MSMQGLVPAPATRPGRRCHRLMSRLLILLASGLTAHASLAASLSDQQRIWLLSQIRLGMATARPELASDAWQRLQMLAPEDPAILQQGVLLAMSQHRGDDARRYFEQLQHLTRDPELLEPARQALALDQPQVQAALHRARLFETAGQNAQAIASFRSIFGDRPPTLDLAVEYWSLLTRDPAQREQAIARLQVLNDDYPGYAPLRWALIGPLFAAGHPQQAIMVLHQLASTPGNREVASEREFAYLKSLPVDASTIRLWQSFLATYPGVSAWEQARQILDRQQHLAGDPAWRDGQRGMTLSQNGRDQALAQSLLQRALQHYPDDPKLLGYYALSLFQSARYDQAAIYFKKATMLEDDPYFMTKWRTLHQDTLYWQELRHADQALSRQQLDAATRLYTLAHQQRPDNINARLGMADVAIARRQWPRAIELLNAVRTLHPGDDGALRRLLNIHAEMGSSSLHDFLATLPAPVAARYRPREMALRRDELSRRAGEARQHGDMALAIRLLQQAHAATPDDPWLSLQLARTLQDQGRNTEAEQVFARVSVDSPIELRYARALYLDGSGRDPQALILLQTMHGARMTAEMQQLEHQIRIRQLTRRVWSELQARHFGIASDLVKQLPDTLDTWRLQAELARQQGHHDTQLAIDRRLLAQWPQRIDLRLDEIDALLQLQRTGEARSRLEPLAAASLAPSASDRRRMARDWSQLGEPRRAAAQMRAALADEAHPSALDLRDLARWERKDDPARALQDDARALQQLRLLPATITTPADPAQLTRATRARDSDDWLRQSLRSDIAEYYQRTDPVLTLDEGLNSRSNGQAGATDLRNQTQMLDYAFPWVTGRAFVRLEHQQLDAGSFRLNSGGRYLDDFGSCLFAGLDSLGRYQQLPGCSNRQHQHADGVLLAGGWQSADGRVQADIGHSPFGYAVGNWLGGISWRGDLGWLGWRLTGSRRPMDNSLISLAGAIDPRTGQRWGGVTANGATLGLSVDQGGSDGAWASLGAHLMLGRNVPSNFRQTAMAGWYHRFVERTHLQIRSGLSLMYWGYRHNQDYFSLGNGDYYSPSRYTSIGLPLTIAWRSADWSALIDASASWSWAGLDPSRRFPIERLIRTPLAALQAQASPATIDTAQWLNAGGRSQGPGARLHLALERRLGAHWVLGTSFTVQHSQDYAPSYGRLYIRYSFHPWEGDLPMPVTPLTPYDNFR